MLESRLLASLVTRVALIITTIAVTSLVSYCFYNLQVPVSVGMPYIVSVGTPFTYESEFPQEKLGVLNTSNWVADPQLISGTHYIESGMLKIVSNSRYQVEFGIKWKSPTYFNNDWEPWLP
jgi:hypothetical protein